MKRDFEIAIVKPVPEVLTVSRPPLLPFPCNVTVKPSASL
jgi:hypothetical protein